MKRKWNSNKTNSNKTNNNKRRKKWCTFARAMDLANDWMEPKSSNGSNGWQPPTWCHHSMATTTTSKRSKQRDEMNYTNLIWKG